MSPLALLGSRTRAMSPDEHEDEHRFLTPLKVSLVAIVVLGLMGVVTSAYISGERLPASTPVANSQAVLAKIEGLQDNQQLELSREDVEQLRQNGWSCPDLAGLGFTVRFTTAGLLDGEPIFRRILSYGQYIVALYEQQGAHRGSDGAPINPLTHQSVLKEGFVKGAATADGELWYKDGPSWTAILSTKEQTFTFTSTLPISWIPNVTSQVAFNESTKIQEDSYTGPDTVFERVKRGFDRIFAGAF